MRSKRCARCVELETQVAQWREDYKKLAQAMAEGLGQAEAAIVRPLNPPAPKIPAEPPLPPTVFAAIEDTTPAHSEARTAAIEAARGLLESGVTPEEVEAQLRKGEEIAV